MNINKTYLEKRLKVLLPKSILSTPTTETKVNAATIAKNIESLGYVFSRAAFGRITHLTPKQSEEFYKEIVPVLKEMRGVRDYNPLYPNFPQQVLDASQCVLYSMAQLTYWSDFMFDIGVTDQTWNPQFKKDERFPLTEKTKIDVINLGNEKDFNTIFTSLVGSKTSISESDKEIVTWFVENYKDGVVPLLPEKITMKEQLSLVVSLLLKHTNSSDALIKLVKTPTDVLRIATALSDGDVSLAENTKFAKFKRSERRLLLSLLNQCHSPKEEMVKYKTQWIRLGERLHPSEYSIKYPIAAEAFFALRNDEKIVTFNGKVEGFLLNNEVEDAVNLLVTRPGDFARRLDHILRLSDSDKELFARTFLSVSDKVSTNVLLQLQTHFQTRSETNFRPVFPKGNLAKIHVVEEPRAVIDQKFCDKLAKNIREVLVKRFSSLDKLGKVYIDEELKNYLIPFSQRSASKALKTIVRGSKIPLGTNADTIRFFIWWKDSQKSGRTDLDLSAVVLDDKWNHIDVISYYNLKTFGGHHSGDIRSAPRGASEFIDVSIEKVIDRGGRYIAMSVNSFTSEPLCDLPECFAGWMGRKKADSGEIYEPKTVLNKIDLASDTTISIPMVIDIVERKIIWTDLALKNRADFYNNVANNSKSTSLVCKAMSEVKKPNLFELFSIHAEGRGTIVTDKSEADVVFSAQTTPFDIDTIVTKFI